jgi:Mg-chelatase subunit ChlD
MTLDANAIARLSEFDFIAVVDTSGSMAEPNKAGTTSPTRWEAVQESLRTLIRDLSKIDSDGIGMVQLGGNLQTWDCVTEENALNVFKDLSPRGGTPLAEALAKAFNMAGKNAKKDFIVVYTDGVPDDAEAVKKVILNQANSQVSDDACTVLFVQVGDDKYATKFLQDLDDNLKGAKFDIVDAKTVAEVDAFASTAELILAAIAG